MTERQPGLDGASVIITGAARGQGALEAELIAASGAYVVITDVLEEQGQDVAAKIVSAGAKATFVPLDVTDARGWERVVRRTLETTGRIDALVNNAGIAATARLGELDLDTFKRVMEINVFGAVLGINAVSPAMVERGAGSIVNVASIAGQTAWPSASYSMSKWAMTGLTKIASLELGPRGVRVNSVHPGVIDTEFAASMSDELRQNYVNATPMGRIGRSEDVAPLVAFLCSSSSQYVSGTAISVDGGLIGAGAVHSVFSRLSSDAR
ncbi:SDR family NAD(P)-dependent oxidoreductase [Streptomyces hygroscopicus]|uniref:SDR family NAD(P)-dependent oxidoreductase n=1 Tax=Streptomyces hygroscopicus TaxID=1912 RepID=UPI003642D087